MSGQSNSRPLVEVKNLKVYFDINVGFLKSKPLKAVDDVSFSIKKGETLGLVGESAAVKLSSAVHYCTCIVSKTAKSGTKAKRLLQEDLQQFRRKAAMVFQIHIPP